MCNTYRLDKNEARERQPRTETEILLLSPNNFALSLLHYFVVVSFLCVD